MGLYEAFKEVLSVAQKADNVDLYRQLLDLNAQALDLQEENTRLKNEIHELQKTRDVESKIERHSEPYITLRDDSKKTPYCAVCWGKDRVLIQLSAYGKCAVCHNRCSFE